MDNDCDGSTDEGFDQDGDGYLTCENDCDDTDPTVYPGATELCDGVDNNCADGIDEEPGKLTVAQVGIDKKLVGFSRPANYLQTDVMDARIVRVDIDQLVEQFVVRREVFRMMQESFRENGIEFAHRNVTVYLPPEATGSENNKVNEKVAEATAAAAIAAEQADEKQPKKLK